MDWTSKFSGMKADDEHKKAAQERAVEEANVRSIEQRQAASVALNQVAMPAFREIELSAKKAGYPAVANQKTQQIVSGFGAGSMFTSEASLKFYNEKGTLEWGIGLSYVSGVQFDVLRETWNGFKHRNALNVDALTKEWIDREVGDLIEKSRR
jgi:hypothetical protein